MEVATYPILLLIFLVGIMWGLKNYLLPQLNSGSNFSTLLINHLPLVFFSFGAFIFLLTALSVTLFKRKSAIMNFTFLVKLPLVHSFIRLYLTAYFAREWGNLIAQGVELRQIINLMKKQKSRIFSEVGKNLDLELNAGRSFEQAVSKLALYADECWEQFFTKIDRLMQLIQPLVFIFVALMIILLYAAMLLPIYSNMGSGI